MKFVLAFYETFNNSFKIRFATLNMARTPSSIKSITKIEHV